MYRFRRNGKYNNRRFYVNGIAFDSQREGLRYRDLKLLEDAGEISGLRRQVAFELIPVQREPDQVGPRGGVKKGAILERAVEYVADFVYQDRDGKTVVEDVKGYKGGEAYKLFSLKRKMMLFFLGIRVKEV